MAATLGPVTIQCPGCGERLAVPTKLVLDTPGTSTVLVRMDYTETRKHFQECAKRAKAPQAGTELERHTPNQPDVPRAVLAGRVHRLLDMRAYVTPGKRACTMCGTGNAECMDGLSKQQPCCPSCGGGNTHPVPQETLACAEWAERQASAQH